MALTWDVSCKECGKGFQIYDDEAHAITMGEHPGPFCSDECLDKHPEQGYHAPMTEPKMTAKTHNTMYLAIGTQGDTGG